MAPNGNGLKTSIPRDKFIAMPHEEQSYLIYNAVKGNEQRITALEEKTSSWLYKSKAVIGGIIGAILFFGGKCVLALIGK